MEHQGGPTSWYQAKEAERSAERGGLVPTTIPTDFVQPWEVFDQELFDLEMVRVFARSWVWLGDIEDLVKPGDFITGTIGYQPVIVIRQSDGGVKGFLNNCRHRASGLEFTPSGNCGSTLTCPYHNWAYNISGELIGIPDKKRMYGDDFPMEDFGLVPFRVEVAWGKFVFGCLSRKAPTFTEWIAPLKERYDLYGFERFHRFPRELSEVYRFNWKLLVENANDDYHVRFVHRRLNQRSATMDVELEWEGYTTSGYKPRKADYDISGGRTDLPPKMLRGGFADHIYPNLVPLPKPDLLWMVRIDPLTPDTTRLFSRVYGLTDSAEEMEEAVHQLELTNKEDTDMVTILMENLRSPFYRAGPVSNWERRAAHLMQQVRADVARPLAPDEFDGPID